MSANFVVFEAPTKRLAQHVRSYEWKLAYPWNFHPENYFS